MKTNLFRIIMVSVLSMSAMFSYGQCEGKIRDFYLAYMRNVETDPEANAELMGCHMSPELIAKLADYTAQYDADAVIHAQDVSKYGMESLIVVPIEGTDDGYLVDFKLDTGSWNELNTRR
ncbi:MAG: YbjP/YqhG family protein, partial [Paramuribaculum sp.]|nr:YbjP/YqhG family protein [Paramuribaculum sp.]